MVCLIMCFCHVTYLYWVKLLESQETPRSKQGRYPKLKFKTLLKPTSTQLENQTLSHLDKLIKLKDCFTKIYMYDVFFKVLRSNPVAVA